MSTTRPATLASARHAPGMSVGANSGRAAAAVAAVAAVTAAVPAAPEVAATSAASAPPAPAAAFLVDVATARASPALPAGRRPEATRPRMAARSVVVREPRPRSYAEGSSSSSKPSSMRCALQARSTRGGRCSCAQSNQSRYICGTDTTPPLRLRRFLLHCLCFAARCPLPLQHHRPGASGQTQQGEPAGCPKHQRQPAAA